MRHFGPRASRMTPSWTPRSSDRRRVPRARANNALHNEQRGRRTVQMQAARECAMTIASDEPIVAGAVRGMMTAAGFGDIEVVQSVSAALELTQLGGLAVIDS